MACHSNFFTLCRRLRILPARSTTDKEAATQRLCSHCTENLIYVITELKLRGLVPNSVSDLYIRRIGLPIWLQQNRSNNPGNKLIAHRYMNVENRNQTVILYSHQPFICSAWWIFNIYAFCQVTLWPKKIRSWDQKKKISIVSNKKIMFKKVTNNSKVGCSYDWP
jgi:hypothetical protein